MMNRRIFAFGLMIAALGACNTIWAGNPGRTKDIGVGISPAPPTSSASDRIAYKCADGTGFTATFDDAKGVVTIERTGSAPVSLPRRETGSGFRYGNGNYDLTGKGDEANWTVGRKASIKCMAQPAI